MFQQRLRQQRLESEADSKWLQQEEQNIELPFSPVSVKYFLCFSFVMTYSTPALFFVIFGWLSEVDADPPKRLKMFGSSSGQILDVRRSL